MSDDFEGDLRRRLTDLAGSADADRPWDDPLPAATRADTAARFDDPATPDATTDDAGVVVPLQRRRRGRWTTAAVAAVVAALVVGGGFGLRALVRQGDDAGRGTAPAVAAGGGSATAGGGETLAPGGAETVAPGGANGPAGSNDGGTADGTCTTAATSTGPLATVASIRPNSTLAPRTTSGGSAAVGYQLTFGQAGGTAQLRAASVVLVRDGALCPAGGTARSGAIEAVPVEPGAGQTGTATFLAVGPSGDPLPAGQYRAAVVVPYSVDGSGPAQLVSPPVTVTVG